MILSILICNRVLRELYKGCDIFAFFDSCMTHLSKYTNDIEFLLKLDDDDSYVPEVLEGLKKYPFIIRPFVWGRWEGRNCINLHHNHLFQRKNPESKFIMFMSDDSSIEHDFMPELLTSMKDPRYPYIIVSDNGGRNEILKEVGLNYRTDYRWVQAASAAHVMIPPKIIEVTGNMGNQLNPDTHFGLLHTILYTKYGIDIWCGIHHFGGRVDDTGVKRLPDNIGITFNDDMQISNIVKCKNQYLFDLTEQQALNLYLNMKHDGKIK